MISTNEITAMLWGLKWKRGSNRLTVWATSEWFSIGMQATVLLFYIQNTIAFEADGICEHFNKSYELK